MTAADVVGFLGGAKLSEGEWRFELGRHLHGAFGGAFGGAVAACAVLTARDLASGRVPCSLDVRFLRSLPAGSTRVVATRLHGGRSLTSVSVDVVDGEGRLGGRATVSLVDRASLLPLDRGGVSSPLPAQEALSSQEAVEPGTPWRAPAGVEIPILDTLEPRILGRDGHGVATTVRVPWRDDGAAAEATCLAADLCVGPPVAAALDARRAQHPNPDLSLRLASDVTTAELVGIGYLERIHAGVAVVRIEVRSGSALVAIGVSSSLLLRSSRE